MKYIPTKIRNRPYTDAFRRLKEGKLRPTKQRLALSKLLFEGEDRHLTAESLYEEACSFGIKVSLATVYNTLNQFTEAGLLREVVVAPGRSYFDTNTHHHHHFYCKEDDNLKDISEDQISLTILPDPPADMLIDRVSVVVHLKRNHKSDDDNNY